MRSRLHRRVDHILAVVILYALLGTTTILVLRGMSRRFRRAGRFTDLDTPYGLSALTEGAVEGYGRMSTAVAACCCWPSSRTRSSGGRLWGGFLGPDRRGT